MDLGCRSCLSKNQDYVSLLSVIPEFGEQSILDMLNFVTSFEIIYSEDFPQEICLTCLKDLKSAYRFILLFNNSQKVLQEATQEHPKESIETSGVTTLDFAESVKNKNISENIVIVNEDGSTFFVEEIFGTEENKKKNESIQKQIKALDTKKLDKSHKIILVSVDDVLKPRLKQKSLMPPDKNLFRAIQKKAINSSKEQDEVFFNEEEEVIFNKEDEVFFSEENEVIFIEDDVDGASSHNIEKDNIPQDDKSDSEEDQDVEQETIEMEKNRERNINNIQIVTIDDVLNSTKKQKNDQGKKMTIQDVLDMKPRSKSKTSDGPEIFLCEICNTTYDRRRKLMLHQRRQHNPNWKEKLKCKICGLECKTLSAYKHHLERHKGIKYPCTQCDKTYLTKSKMTEHILRIHEKKYDNRYLCPKCGRGFKFLGGLQYHMNKHTNSRNFVCRYCGFACMALGALNRHERVHTGERPYECKHCKKTFAGAAEKQKHEFSHEGVFRYSCKYCNKKFIQTYNMRVHWMQHKGPYVCEICPRNFADAEILKFHYAHSHKIKDVIIEEAEEKSDEEVVEDESVLD